MPQITMNGQAYEVPSGKRLVLAIEDSGIPILHRCGGYAKCTTCRVKFLEGEPHQMTEAENVRLAMDPNLNGKVRLSCQIVCEQDMSVQPVLTMHNADVSDPGKRPEDRLTPDPIWLDKR